MYNNKDYCFIGEYLIKLGNRIEYKGNITLFNSSQRKPRHGTYILERVDIKDIDVVIKNIANREFFSFDYEFNNKHITNLKECFEKTPPVILEKNKGIYYSIDGHHRITAANELGIHSILAFVINTDNLE